MTAYDFDVLIPSTKELIDPKLHHPQFCRFLLFLNKKFSEGETFVTVKETAKMLKMSYPIFL